VPFYTSTSTGRLAVAVVTGDLHTCVLVVDGSVVCWGSNSYGQLGTGRADSVGTSPSQMGHNLVPAMLNSGCIRFLIERSRVYRPVCARDERDETALIAHECVRETKETGARERERASERARKREKERREREREGGREREGERERESTEKRRGSDGANTRRREETNPGGTFC
jgi:hypothetical protein